MPVISLSPGITAQFSWMKNPNVGLELQPWDTSWSMNLCLTVNTHPSISLIYTHTQTNKGNIRAEKPPGIHMLMIYEQKALRQHFSLVFFHFSVEDVATIWCNLSKHGLCHSECKLQGPSPVYAYVFKSPPQPRDLYNYFEQISKWHDCHPQFPLAWLSFAHRDLHVTGFLSTHKCTQPWNSNRITGWITQKAVNKTSLLHLESHPVLTFWSLS